MSVKHIKKYYDQICNDYQEMLETVHDLEDAVSNNIVSEEQLNDVKKSLEVIKTNYMRWSYMMYLLNMPNKKDKKKVYEKRMEQYLSNIPKKDTIEGVRHENSIAQDKFKKDIANLSE